MFSPLARNSSATLVSRSAIIPLHSRLPFSMTRPASWPPMSLIRNGTPRNGCAP